MTDFFSLFGFSTSPVVNYIDYLQPNQKFEIKRGVEVIGFQAKKQGRYIFEVNLNAKGNIEVFYFQSAGKKIDFIEKEKKKEITFDLNPNDFVYVFPGLKNDKEDLEFTIEPDSYVKVIYSWKYI